MAAALLALAAGCGQSSSPSDGVASVKRTQSAVAASASPTASVDVEEQGRRYAKCMRDNGVDMSDPQPNGKGGYRLSIGGKKEDLDHAKIDKAMQACRSLDPGAEKKKDFAPTPEEQERARAFAKCMRAHGIDMPDPDLSDGGPIRLVIGGPGSEHRMEPDDPKLVKAMEACRGDSMPVEIR
ncbi:hypothetical protein [Sphaerisporangium perillae]|uniref:hypothetical protein n=1 Tax=Sphaerisporangium perillae TaxID=2935860 RepID=UPI00200FB7ED|nr:hypothetical protein [Sphaerisporangium perillae]